MMEIILNRQQKLIIEKFRPFFTQLIKESPNDGFSPWIKCRKGEL